MKKLGLFFAWLLSQTPIKSCLKKIWQKREKEERKDSEEKVESHTGDVPWV